MVAVSIVGFDKDLGVAVIDIVSGACESGAMNLPISMVCAINVFLPFPFPPVANCHSSVSPYSDDISEESKH